MIAGAILFLLHNKWTWWLGVAVVFVLAYFGWRAHERGIGAAKVIDEFRKAADKHNRDTADQVRKSDEAVADPRGSRAQRVRDRFSRD